MGLNSGPGLGTGAYVVEGGGASVTPASEGLLAGDLNWFWGPGSVSTYGALRARVERD
eukprot:CAMPEP_0180040764 /NCGR_PEP_ID=MMETSP0984-20121128/33674_1 /TAXON_ID=483367 /ORGANISM="non described non described, Strain CCMP 2436" /LENGTH=57 /DNA_ID=CAMNT_0021968107 /DNA_START=32 /DNA_END=202 /DNA_ORIENTATION=+